MPVAEIAERTGSEARATMGSLCLHKQWSPCHSLSLHRFEPLSHESARGGCAVPLLKRGVDGEVEGGVVGWRGVGGGWI